METIQTSTDTKVQIFNNVQFGNVRIVMSEDESPLFCLADLCKAVELTNPSNVKSRLDKEDVQLVDLHALSCSQSGGVGNTMASFVNETGFYEVLLFSSSPKVKPFRRWVTSEVLPTIRKTGGYIVTHQEDTPEMIMAKALQIAQSTIERNRLQLEQANNTIIEQAPKVEYHDKCLDSKGYLTVNMIAAELGISHIKLNKLLCGWGIQYKQSDCYFLYSDYREKGYTVHRPYPYVNSQGITVTKQQMRWTEKGKKFIIELYYKKAA